MNRHIDLFWVLIVWCLVSLAYCPGLLVFSIGLTLCILLIFLKSPDLFWNLLALCARDPDTKERFFKKGIRSNPKKAYPYLKLGLIYFKKRQWQKAVHLLEEVRSTLKEKAGFELKYMLAAACRENWDYGKSAALLEEIIDSGKEDAEIYFNLAFCHFQKKDYDRALGAAKKAQELNPEAVRPVMLMGRIHFAHHDFKAARKHYLWLAERLPKPVESLYWLGRCEYELGDGDNAKKHLQTAFALISETPALSSVPSADAREWLEKAKAASEKRETGESSCLLKTHTGPVIGKRHSAL